MPVQNIERESEATEMKDLCIRAATKTVPGIKKYIRDLLKGERGAAEIIAVVVIIAIVVVLGVVFKDRIIELFNKLFPSDESIAELTARPT